MNLETEVSDDLWYAIEKTYNANNYSHAILDATHFLSEAIRDITGLDGDGASLINRAFGGENPLLKLNRLQTETEKNQQQGFAFLLRGIYQAIRNTRSHELIVDDQETADAIIIFINYLIKEIKKSEESFSLSKFIQRVFDPDFVHNKKYGDLLVSEIPENKKFDTLVEIYRRKTEGDIDSVGIIIQSLLINLSAEQLKQFLSIVSEELKETRNNVEISANLYIIPPNLWCELSETARLRIENKVLKSINEGKYTYGNIVNGELATWAKDHFVKFSLKNELEETFHKKFLSSDHDDLYYVIEYFFEQLPLIICTPWRIISCVKELSKCVKEGDEFVRSELVHVIQEFPPNWQQLFVKELKSITCKEAPEIYLPDGTPFLSKPTNDDIPF